MKGTGRWTIQEAAERSVVGSVMAAALDTRYVSGRKDERVLASKTLFGPPKARAPSSFPYDQNPLAPPPEAGMIQGRGSEIHLSSGFICVICSLNAFITIALSHLRIHLRSL